MIRLLACAFGVASSKLVTNPDPEHVGPPSVLPLDPIPIEEITVCGGKGGVKGFRLTGKQKNRLGWIKTDGEQCAINARNTIQMSKRNCDGTHTLPMHVVDEIAFGYDKYFNIMYVEVAFRGNTASKLIGSRHYVTEVHS